MTITLIRPESKIHKFLDSPRKAYLDLLRNRILNDVENRLKILSVYKEFHGETIFINGSFVQIDDVAQSYRLVHSLIEKSTMLAEVRIAFDLLKSENERFDDLFDTIRILFIMEGR